jgi:hypothetical protein
VDVGGGHMADPSTGMSTYHPGINRWSLPYVAEYLDKGQTFNGRPDCRNHTNLTYAYDPARNRWCLTSIVKCPGELGGVSIGMMYDAKRELVWAQSNSQRMYVLRVDAPTLTLSDAAGN